MSALDDLKAADTAEAAVVTQVLAEIDTLASQLLTASQNNDDAGVEAIVGDIQARTAAMQAKLAPATPVDTTPPATDPTPAATPAGS